MEVEPLDDGRARITITYRDDDADAMWVIGGVVGNAPVDRRLTRDADGLWTGTWELERDARVSYWLTRVAVPVGISDLIVDPGAPATWVFAPNPDDPEDEEMEIALVELPGAPPLRWSTRRDGVPRGTVATERLRSELLENERNVYLYTPPGYDPAVEYPLVLCFDGFAYVDETYAPLPTVLDNLIAEGSIPPAVAVLPNTLDSASRQRELGLDEAFLHFVTDELLPWARGRVSFTDDPGRTVAAGASLGGLAAAFCGYRRPDRFGLVLSQSGSFQRGLPREFAVSDRLPLRFVLQVGRYETMPFERFPSLLHANAHLRDVLVAKGYDVTYEEYAGGHDFFWWRETIADGLVTLLA